MKEGFRVMSKSKIILASMFAVFAFAAVTSTASAAEAWRVNGTTLTTGSLFTIALVAGLSAVNKLTWLGGEAEISCKTIDVESGWIAGPNKKGAKSLVIGGCTVAKPSHCAITGGSIATNEVRAHLLEAKPEVTIEPLNGTTFGEFKLENFGGTCSLNGKKLKLKGKANGTVLKPTEETTLKEFSFATGAGELTIGASETEQENALATGTVSLKLELPNFTWSVV
jgi:hypothetical protein